MKKILVFLATIVLIYILVSSFSSSKAEDKRATFWNFQAVDTMKYSRDISREKLNDPYFAKFIDAQMAEIAKTGATHVGIATPYDEEFLPIMKLWVNSARKHNLKIWFRGNFSGWEGWFEYEKIDREQHKELTKQFILDNPYLFEDGDVFSACPECENGGPGDPRLNGDAEGHKQFLIDEYQITKDSFKTIKKDVASNYLSMNGDVARLIMDKETTKALDGVVTIDHYVRTPEQLSEDITEIAKQSGGVIILGEYGAPIPDIHGQMTQDQQEAWLSEAYALLVKNPHVAGLSYWTNVGGSTELWDSNNKPRKAVQAVTQTYNPKQAKGVVENEAGKGLPGVLIQGNERAILTNSEGYFALPILEEGKEITVSLDGYREQKFTPNDDEENYTIVLVKNNESVLFKIQKFINKLIPTL